MTPDLGLSGCCATNGTSYAGHTRGGVGCSIRGRRGVMMNLRKSVGILGSTFLAGLSWSGPAQSEAPKTAYPQMAPAEQYRIASREDEIALARSAAPPSISADAEVLVLGSRG